tara:strand:- start:1325 stop:1483 length:159 start_codon:yes stop_codon:yes gene_type:complete
MDKNQALDVLKQVAELAQKAGLFKMEDVSTVLIAIETLEKDENNNISTTTES